MGYNICKECGMLFMQIEMHNFICPSCQKKEIEEISKVTEFLRNNPRSTGTAISLSTGISTEKIKKWIIEEKISINGNLGLASCKIYKKPVEITNRIKTKWHNGKLQKNHMGFLKIVKA
jgi:hypothetical protein